MPIIEIEQYETYIRKYRIHVENPENARAEALARLIDANDLPEEDRLAKFEHDDPVFLEVNLFDGIGSENIEGLEEEVESIGRVDLIDDERWLPAIHSIRIAED